MIGIFGNDRKIKCLKLLHFPSLICPVWANVRREPSLQRCQYRPFPCTNQEKNAGLFVFWGSEQGKTGNNLVKIGKIRIELDDKSHNTKKAINRDAVKNNALKESKNHYVRIRLEQTEIRLMKHRYQFLKVLAFKHMRSIIHSSAEYRT